MLFYQLARGAGPLPPVLPRTPPKTRENSIKTLKYTRKFEENAMGAVLYSFGDSLGHFGTSFGYSGVPLDPLNLDKTRENTRKLDKTREISRTLKNGLL